MGTTMSFYFVQNKGDSVTDLKDKLNQFGTKKTSEIDTLIAMLPQDMQGQFKEAMKQREKSKASFASFFNSPTKPVENKTVLGYCDSAAWLPFFDERMCEGNIACSKDAKKLSKLFAAPVLALAVFDSDIMFVSFCDAAQGIVYDYAKPNLDDMEEYDADLYSTDFPAFLLEFCPPEHHDELKDVWAEPEMVFADDRMGEICEILSCPLVYASNELPDGYQPIYCD